VKFDFVFVIWTFLFSNMKRLRMFP